MRLLLDTNVLRRLCHPGRNEQVGAWYRGWINYGLAGGDVEIVISAVADYELRRGYMYALSGSKDIRKSLAQLDELCGLWEVQQVSARNLRDAAGLWADARRGGYSTADERAVDWDVIIAAQALEKPAVVVTSNGKHLARYGIDARDWDRIPVPEETEGA